MERVDEGHRAREAEAGVAAPGAESVEEVRLGGAGEAALDQPDRDALEVAVVHGPIVPTRRRRLNRVRERLVKVTGTPDGEFRGGHPILSAGVVPPAVLRSV